jgi:putative photosynthetic complex assembly protein
VHAQAPAVLAFDVFGTVVDWHGSIRREVERKFPGIDGDAFARAWRAGNKPAMARVMRGEQGFLRGVLRGLARDRRQHGVGAEAPYLLSLHDDGRLLITDPSTGQRIDLASFGVDNAAVFTQWLPTATPLHPTSKGLAP